MAKLWQLENFSRGIHTKPARIEGGEQYAADIENLQVDGDGFLRLRSPVTAVGATGTALITGVAATARHLFLLRSDGRLSVRSLDNLMVEKEIRGVENMERRISVVAPAGADYVILTSEGDDQGYWIDLRHNSFGQAHPLGISPPPSRNVDVSVEILDGAEGLAAGIYGYAFTWLRNEQHAPLDGMESNPEGTRAVHVTSNQRVRFYDVDFTDDLQVTHLAIYRTQAPVMAENDIFGQPFRRVGTIEREETEFVDTGEVEWASGVLLNRFNDRMPLGVKSIHLHNGRIFAPAGDRLIYSDFDGTIPRYWAFPKKNFLSRSDGRRVDFCARHREVLLVGASDGLFRLDGRDALDFNLDQISGAGPLDGFSWNVSLNTLGFVGLTGFFITDAATVELVSDESLDGFFTDREIRRGLVGFFVDNTLLFFADNDLFRFDDRHWVRWTGVGAKQVAAARGQIYLAGTPTLRQMGREIEHTDTELPWAWESNWIYGQADRRSGERKRFRELYLTAAAGTTMTLRTWVDNSEQAVEQTFTTRDDLYYQRIPIERIGKRLRFRLEGKGPVEIRVMEVHGEV